MFVSEKFRNTTFNHETFVDCMFYKCELYDCELKGKVFGQDVKFFRCSGENIDMRVICIHESECTYTYMKEDGEDDQDEIPETIYLRQSISAQFGGFLINTKSNKIIRRSDYCITFENDLLNEDETGQTGLTGDAIGLFYVVIGKIEIRNFAPNSYVNVHGNQVFCCLSTEKLELAKIENCGILNAILHRRYRITMHINVPLWVFLQKQIEFVYQNNEIEKTYERIIKFLLDSLLPKLKEFETMLKDEGLPNIRDHSETFKIAKFVEHSLCDELRNKMFTTITQSLTSTA